MAGCARDAPRFLWNGGENPSGLDCRGSGCRANISVSGSLLLRRWTGMRNRRELPLGHIRQLLLAVLLCCFNGTYIQCVDCYKNGTQHDLVCITASSTGCSCSADYIC